MRSKTVSYLMVILAMLIWGTLALFVKNVGYTSAEIVLGRIVFGLAFLLVIYAVSKKKSGKEVIKKFLPRLLLTGAAMGFNWVALFESYRWVDVSIATLCYYVSPVVVMLGSLVFYKERLSAARIAGTVAAVAGMFIVTGAVMGGADPLKGVALGLISAVLYASVTLVNKAVRGLTGLEVTLVQLMGALAVILPYVLITHEGPWRAPQAGELVSIMTLGLVHTGVALYLYFSSIQRLPVQSVALLSYIDPLSALGFAALFLGDRLSGMQWIGAALILGGAIVGEVFTKNPVKEE